VRAAVRASDAARWEASEGPKYTSRRAACGVVSISGRPCFSSRVAV
jgi:hypothetical protein